MELSVNSHLKIKKELSIGKKNELERPYIFLASKPSAASAKGIKDEGVVF